MFLLFKQENALSRILFGKSCLHFRPIPLFLTDHCGVSYTKRTFTECKVNLETAEY